MRESLRERSADVRGYFQKRGGKPMGEVQPIFWIHTLNDDRFF